MIEWSFIAFKLTYEVESVSGSHNKEIFTGLILQMVISIFLAFPAFRIRSIFPKRNKLRFLAGAGIIIYNAWTFLKILLGMINYANYYNSSFFEFISYRTDMQVRLVSLLFYILIGILICAPFVKKDRKVIIDFESTHEEPLVIFSLEDISGFKDRLQKKVKNDFEPFLDKATWDPYATKKIKNESTYEGSFTEHSAEKNKFDQLRAYKKLFDEGTINEEEFTNLKNKFL